MTYKDDDDLKREMLDAMVVSGGFVSRVAATIHINASTIFRWIAQSEISPDSNKLEWGENGVKPLHVHAKLARRMGRLIERSDYFEDETPQPERPAPYVDDAEDVDDAARIARARSDVAKGPQMHPPRKSIDRMREDGDLAIEMEAREAHAKETRRAGLERREAAKAAVNGDLTNPNPPDEIESAPAPAPTGDGRLDTLNALLAKIERRGDGPTDMENDIIARLQQAPSRPRPQGAPVTIFKPEDEPREIAPAPSRPPRKLWSPSAAPAPVPRPSPKEGQPLAVPHGRASAEFDAEGLGRGDPRPGGVKMK